MTGSESKQMLAEFWIGCSTQMCTMEPPLKIVVVGMRFIGMTAADVAACEEVRLVPEPENKFDPHAITVLDHLDGSLLGHVSREDCAKVRRAAPSIDADKAAAFPVMYAYKAPNSVELVLEVKKQK